MATPTALIVEGPLLIFASTQRPLAGVWVRRVRRADFLTIENSFLPSRLWPGFMPRVPTYRAVQNFETTSESARRFKVDLTPFPNIVAIDQACAELDAFRKAAPKLQPDAL